MLYIRFENDMENSPRELLRWDGGRGKEAIFMIIHVVCLSCQKHKYIHTQINTIYFSKYLSVCVYVFKA